MSTPKFSKTHNLVAFLEKPKESNGFEEIIDFLNASSVQYALTVNPTIYITCIEQFWTSAKVKTVNEERQIQALVDKKKEIISKTSIRSDLKLDDAEGTNFFLDKEVEGMSKHKGVYVTPSHTKKVFANMKRPCKGFFGRVTPLFSIMMVQVTEDMGADSATLTDSHYIPIITQPSSLKPQKKKSRRKQRKDSAPTEPTTKETTPEEHVSTLSYDPPLSGKDRMQLAELMSLCTNLQEKVLDLEKANTAQAKDIASLKKRIKQLEKRRKSKTSGLRRLRKGRKIEDLDADAEVTLVDETQKINDDNLMFDIVSAAEVVTTTSASVEILYELTPAQILIEIKTTKPKLITTAATTVTFTKTFSSSQS
ncbi:hypothetical protein Tco_0257414 [Tanacetum coccineum]